MVEARKVGTSFFSCPYPKARNSPKGLDGMVFAPPKAFKYESLEVEYKASQR